MGVDTLQFLKRYFLVFILIYLILVATKFLFIFQFQASFTSYSFLEQIYAIFWGYRFDFAVSGIVAFLVTLLDFKSKWYAFVGASFATIVFLAQVGDMFYFAEASRHVGYEINDLFADAFSLFMTAFSQYTWMLVIAISIAIFLFAVIYKVLQKTLSEKINKVYIVKKLFLILLSVFFVRGMFQHIPLNPWQANQIGETKLASIAINGAYNMIFSLTNKAKKLKQIKLPIMTDKELKKTFASIYSDNNMSLQKNFSTKKPNVIFFFLESWSASFLKPYGFQRAEATPKFDVLLQKSLRPRVMIANGHRTTEGMFATLTSFQNPLGKSVAKTQLQDFKYYSIIDALNEKHYSSAFFQGTSKETSGTGSLANSLGFYKSYGKRDVGKRIYEENNWGVHDIDLYNFVLSKLNTNLKEPFVLGINGATTHDDQLPNGVSPIHFVDNETINKQLNVLHFADNALGLFIQTVEQKYPNTIFVLFADHCGGHISGTLQNYEIPFAIYAPHYISPSYLDVVLSQRDIAPTVADIVLGDYKKIFPNFSGKSLLRDKVFFADYYHNGILGIVKDNILLEYNIATMTSQCYKSDRISKQKVQCTPEYDDLKNEILSFTSMSQKLLFDGNVDKFKKYRYPLF